jgi:2-keto-4-pentenoate hydratase/2-oxohepta-3-ene-1,7-dioic acid hydratase in catechol pathway
MYQHQFIDGVSMPFPPGKVVCVGRNYADHIAELSNDTPEQPLLFIKANNAMANMHEKIVIPSAGECHNELELALLIGKPLKNASTEESVEAVAGVGLALDLTLRDVQTQLKQKGHPWERAKAFDGSCPISQFVKPNEFDLTLPIEFELKVNGGIRQQGNTMNMLWPWQELIEHISETFSLYPGDVILTGTPKGVGKLSVDDQIEASLADKLLVRSAVVAAEEVARES